MTIFISFFTILRRNLFLLVQNINLEKRCQLRWAISRSSIQRILKFRICNIAYGALDLELANGHCIDRTSTKISRHCIFMK